MKPKNAVQDLIHVIPAMRALLTFSKASPVITFNNSKALKSLYIDKEKFLKSLNIIILK